MRVDLALGGPGLKAQVPSLEAPPSAGIGAPPSWQVNVKGPTESPGVDHLNSAGGSVKLKRGGEFEEAVSRPKKSRD